MNNCFNKSNYYILSANTNTKQFYFQLQKLLTDKRLRHGNSLCTLIRKYIYGPLPKKIHIPIYQGIFIYMPQIYRRYIRTGSQTDLEKVLSELNAKHPSIKFEYEISKERILFLDTKIYIKKNELHTKIFRKKTDGQTSLNINSEHPKLLKNSMPYSKALQIERICSSKKDFDPYSRELKERFLKQG